ncbi:MAG: hypothetical protein ACK4N5_10845, partial [Myxococcales bacterium]
LKGVDTVIQAMRISYDATSNTWGSTGNRLGLDFTSSNRSVVSVDSATDGFRFALAFDTLDRSGNYEIFVRNTCP